MTTFKSAISICGLSQQRAAEYLGVSIGSVKDWSRGVWDMFADLYARIEGAAHFAASNTEPGLMDRGAMKGVTADLGEDPLPEGADAAAGAMALLLALQVTSD